MKTLILPGFNIKNREWARACAANLKEFDAKVIEWKHWATGNPDDFKPQSEAEFIQTSLTDTPVNIIAKSLGTLVAMHFLLLGGSINKLILCGIPLRDIGEQEKQNYKILSTIPPEKISIMQNEFDPHGTLTEVNQFIGDLELNLKVGKKLRDDHDYPFFADFTQFIASQDPGRETI